MADVDKIVAWVAAGLVDNSRVNNVAIGYGAGWADAYQAVETYYLDPLDASSEQDKHVEFFGVPNMDEMSDIERRIEVFLVANRDKMWGDDQPLVEA